jgi:hypothetical protein
MSASCYTAAASFLSSLAVSISWLSLWLMGDDAEYALSVFVNLLCMVWLPLLVNFIVQYRIHPQPRLLHGILAVTFGYTAAHAASYGMFIQAYPEAARNCDQMVMELSIAGCQVICMVPVLAFLSWTDSRFKSKNFRNSEDFDR